MLIVQGSGIVIIADHLAIAVKKEKIDRGLVSGQKKSGPERHPCFHLYPVILGANGGRRRVLPWMKQPGKHLGPVKFFVCSCLLHILPFACARRIGSGLR